MENSRRILFRLASGLLGAALLSVPLASSAQTAGSGKIVHLVVPFGPGGGQDILARSFNAELGAALGQPVIFDYRPGAGGMVGSAYVGKADPASQTLLVGSAGHTIGALLSSKPPYHPVNDFAAVAHIGTGNQILLSNAKVPAKTLQEFIAYAKANPGKLNYASAGTGSSTHLSMAYFINLAGLKIEHIPYKSNAEQISAVLAGAVQIVGLPNTSALPLARDTRVRMLAVTSKQRSRFAPDLPTVAESGLPDYGYDAWFGLLGPAGTPKPFIDRVNAEMAKIIATPVMAERLARMGLEPLVMSPQAFEQLLRQDYDKLARIVKLSGAKVE